MALISNRIIVLLLSAFAGIALIAWLFFPSSGLAKTTDTVIETVDEFADVSADIQEGSIVSTAVSDQEAFDALVAKMTKIRDQQDSKNCFVEFSGFPVFETAGSSISFEYRSSSDTTKLKLYGGENGQQLVSSNKIEGIKPCLIYESVTATNFRDIFIDANVVFEDKQIVLPENENYFYDVSSFFIFGDGESNSLVYGENLEFDDSLIFTPDGVSMCFFPKISNLGKSDCVSRKGVLNYNCYEELSSAFGKNGVARYCQEDGS